MRKTTALAAAAIAACLTLSSAVAHADSSTGNDNPGSAAVSCPESAPDGSVKGSAKKVNLRKTCRKAVKKAPTPEAGVAIKYAFTALGSNISCGVDDRTAPRTYDTSSLIARAYAYAGLNKLAGKDWAVSSREIIGWDGVPRAAWSEPTTNALPGDIQAYEPSAGAQYTRITNMKITGKLSITAAGQCGKDVVRIDDTKRLAKNSTALGDFTIIPELARR